MRAARARWKIENETFNTLKNQGYHLEHNFGHGDQQLSEAFFTLNLLAFFMHQIFQLVDGLYQRVRTLFSSRRAFWDEVRSAFRLFLFTSWDQVLERMPHAGALLMPVLMVVLAIVNLDLLVTVLFFLAALHVIQSGRLRRLQLPRQACRTARAGRLFARDRLRPARFLPVRAGHVQVQRRLVARLRHGPEPASFTTGGRQLLFPGVLREEVFAWTGASMCGRLCT